MGRRALPCLSHRCYWLITLRTAPRAHAPQISQQTVGSAAPAACLPSSQIEPCCHLLHGASARLGEAFAAATDSPVLTVSFSSQTTRVHAAFTSASQGRPVDGVACCERACRGVQKCSGRVERDRARLPSAKGWMTLLFGSARKVARCRRPERTGRMCQSHSIWRCRRPRRGAHSIWSRSDWIGIDAVLRTTTFTKGRVSFHVQGARTAVFARSGRSPLALAGGHVAVSWANMHARAREVT